MISVQRGFFNDKAIGDTREKLIDLYMNNPSIALSEKNLILELSL